MTDELPPVITDPADWHRGYLYISKWEDYQHRDALRSEPPMKWQKLLTAQLDNDGYRELTPAERGVLHDLRMLTARVGQGRVRVSSAYIQQQLGVRSANLMRHVERLNHAGFIVVRAGKLPAGCWQAAGTEESREGGAPTAHTPTRRKRARAGAAEGAPATNGQGTPYNIDPDTVKAIQAGYEPGWLTDDQIAAVRGEEAL